jgi:hypothetical protein
MAKVIEFYIPSNFRKTGKWISPEERGEMIELPASRRKDVAGAGGGADNANGGLLSIDDVSTNWRG